MLQTFPLNLLFNNARFYLSPPSGTPGGSCNNLYESLNDTPDIAFSTPKSSPQVPGPETLPSQTTFPSLAPPAVPTAIRPSLCLLPFPQSQTSLAPKPDPATPSLLDTSTSFAQMMGRTGSPASFLTCSSGWDPGITCGAATFPSLLHSGPSTDNFHLLAQEANCILSDPEAVVENPQWETKLSQLPRPSSNVPFSVAPPPYFSPSLRGAEFTRRLQPPDFVTSTPPRTVMESPLPSPINGEYSPASQLSLEESTTSSVYDDPFHWDTILAGLPPSPQRSTALAVTVGKDVVVRLSTATSPVPSVGPQGDPTYFGFTTSPGTIPTIVVLNPDSVMVPTQASVSSIIGLYVGQREITQTLAGQTPPESHAREEPEQESDGHSTDEDSSSESEFEIVAVPALKVRLDTILETDEMDVENAFSSLMTLGSMGSGSARISAGEEQNSTEFPGNGRALSSFSSVTEPSIDLPSVFSSGQTVQTGPKVPTSTSFASTARLFYAQSGTSISGQSTTSSCHPTVSGSEGDCPWLFYVEDGRILEAPQSTPVHGGGKLADKLARFPNVPKSPQLTPLPSPFASPPASPSPASQFFLGGSSLTPDIKKKPDGTTSLGAENTGSLLSPYWERNISVAFSPGIYKYQHTSAELSPVAEISFGELDVDLGLSSNFGSLVSDSLQTGSPPSSGHGARLSAVQRVTLSYGRHVRFESADFRTSGTAAGQKRHSPHHRRPPLSRSKTCLKKKRRSERAKGWRNPSDTSIPLVGALGVHCDHLPSSFSSGSISKRSSWWQRGRLLVVIGRVRRGIRGCLSVEEEETLDDPVWVTERDHWDDRLAEGGSRRTGDLMGDDDGGALLRRIRRYT